MVMEVIVSRIVWQQCKSHNTKKYYNGGWPGGERFCKNVHGFDIINVSKTKQLS